MKIPKGGGVIDPKAMAAASRKKFGPKAPPFGKAKDAKSGKPPFGKKGKGGKPPFPPKKAGGK